MGDPPIEQPGDLLGLYQRHAKKQFGQHFLTDPHILEALVEAAGVESGDHVLEIGPGCGTLTWTLMDVAAEVVAVEVDRDAVAFLEDVLVARGGLRVVEEDILDCEIDALIDRESTWRCVSNLPYNVGTEVFFRLAEHLDCFECLVLMFQREVAQRFVAETGEDDYGVLSLMAHLYADVEIVKSLAPGAFTPAPRVHSAAVRFEPVEGTRIPEPETRRRFRKVVRTAFQMRRKILPNALAGIGVDKATREQLVEEAGLERTVRPERVSFDGFVRLTRAFEACNDGATDC